MSEFVPEPLRFRRTKVACSRVCRVRVYALSVGVGVLRFGKKRVFCRETQQIVGSEEESRFVASQHFPRFTADLADACDNHYRWLLARRSSIPRVVRTKEISGHHHPSLREGSRTI